MYFQTLILSIIIVELFLTCCLCRPMKGIKDNRIKRLIREIFYIPPYGESYMNASIPLATASDICTYGVCVPYHLCVNGYVVTTGANLFGPRLASEDGSDGPRFCDKMEKCCRLSYDEDNNENVTIDEESDSISEELTNQLDELEYNSNNVDNELLEYTDDWHPKCGIRNFNVLQPRITGEEKAENMEFPWMVVVLKKAPKSKYYDYQCGGSLIHPSVVLTAAHCVAQIRPKLLHIRAGEWDMQSTDEILPHQDREIRSLVIHRDYIKATLANDIAILILKFPVELTENVNTICIPPPNYSFDKERCLVSGWGKDVHGRQGKFQSVLKKVELPIIPNNLCEMMLRKTVLGEYFRLEDTFICAGAEYGKDSCKGDAN